MTNVMNNISIVAVDDGYAQVKSAVFVEGKPVCSKYVTNICPGQNAVASFEGDGNKNAGRTYSTGGEYFTVGGLDAGETTKYDGFHTSPLNRVAVNHALFEHGLANKEVMVCVGLPVSDFFDPQGKRNDSLISLKEENLLQKVVKVNVDEDECVNIKQVKILSQAVAAYIDAAFDWEMNEIIDPASPTVIVDIGGRTTDVALILDGHQIDMSRSGTENIGVLDVHGNLERLIKNRIPKITRKINPETLDRGARDHRMKFFGQITDVKDLVQEAVAMSTGQLSRAIDKLVGSAEDVDHILFVGGGASLFAGMAKNWPQARVVEDPEFANVRGMLKLSLSND